MASIDMFQINGTAKTIDEVLMRLDRIVQHSIDTGSRIGYFAAMYRTVTARMKAEIEAGIIPGWSGWTYALLTVFSMHTQLI
ncbi:hypothetical protein PCURB6_20190 [Paenibacillus curdlanolyticus]|nr:hypothetical protein PCURB6_20190 [Paenibacillus curdlanolyticus]